MKSSKNNGSNGSCNEGSKKAWYEVGEPNDESTLMKIIMTPKSQIDAWALMRTPEFWEENNRQKAGDGAGPAGAAANQMGISEGVPPKEAEGNRKERGDGNAGEMQLDGAQRIQVGISGELEMNQSGHPPVNELLTPQVHDVVLDLRKQVETLTTQVSKLTTQVETLNAFIEKNGIHQNLPDGRSQISENMDKSLDEFAFPGPSVSNNSTTETPSSSNIHPQWQLKCDLCPMTFPNHQSKCIHKQKVHRGKTWDCEYCEKVFSFPAGKSLHIKKSHAQEHQLAKKQVRKREINEKQKNAANGENGDAKKMKRTKETGSK